MSWSSGLVEKLKRGETVQFRPHGNSMVPIIKSGQLVTVRPVMPKGTEVCVPFTIHGEGQGAGLDTPLSVGATVLCKVHGRIMLHKVTAYRAGQYQISNNSGHVNGWTLAKNIYGILVKVEP